MTPAGATWRSVLELSFLKDPHPSGHQLELGQVHHLEMEEENGSTRLPAPPLSDPGVWAPSSFPAPWAQGPAPVSGWNLSCPSGPGAGLLWTCCCCFLCSICRTACRGWGRSQRQEGMMLSLHGNLLSGHGPVPSPWASVFLPH